MRLNTDYMELDSLIAKVQGTLPDNEKLTRNEVKMFEAIFERLAEVSNNGWISVKDRLPNCNGLYLVWRPHFFGGEIGEPSVCYFDGQDTWHDSYGVDFERILNPEDITHWMPLPEPPKEV